MDSLAAIAALKRISAALAAAFAISLVLHAIALFVPAFTIDPPTEPEPRPLIAELRPAVPAVLPEPPPLRILPAVQKTEKVFKPEEASKPKEISDPKKALEPPPKRPPSRKRKKTAATPAASVLAVPDENRPGTAALPEPAAANERLTDERPTDERPPDTPPAGTEAAKSTLSAAAAGRLPPRGRIRFRVDRGDSGFEIGMARQEWTFETGRYRLVSSVETTGLARLIRSVAIDMESIGQISDGGLQPEAFGTMRSGMKARERALFDWQTMKVRVSDNRDYTLDPGAQDMLSFYFQLGFLDIPSGRTVSLPLATGKKYSVYRMENLGDERIETPLGVLDTRHLRTLGENTTEIWLAYEYRLLPVKIRHVDSKGDVYMQVALEILFGP